MKRKNKTGCHPYNNGGQIFQTISQLSPLLNLIPGVGQAAAPLVGGLSQFLAQKANGVNSTSPTNYQNTQPFANGGSLKPLTQDSYEVTGAPYETDGNNLNYKGKNIALNYGETLDTSKDRVISDKYINPETGKKISDEDKRLKRMRAQSEKNGSPTDIASKNTQSLLSSMEDDLYQKQEILAHLNGDRNNMNTIKKYKTGGDIDLPVRDNTQELLNILRQLSIHSPQKIEDSEKPLPFPEDVIWSDGSIKNGFYNKTQSNETTTTTKGQSFNSKNTGSSKIKDLQAKLVSLGYDNIGRAGIKGNIDGIMGERTRSALRKAIASGKLDESYNNFLNTTKVLNNQSKLENKQEVNNNNSNNYNPQPYNPKKANVGQDQNGIYYDTDKAVSVYQTTTGQIVYRAPEYDGTGKNKNYKYLIRKDDGTYGSFESLDAVKRFDKVKQNKLSEYDTKINNLNNTINNYNQDIVVKTKNIENINNNIITNNNNLTNAQKRIQEFKEKEKRMNSHFSNTFNNTIQDYSTIAKKVKENDDNNKLNVLQHRILAQVNKKEAIEEAERQRNSIQSQRKKMANGGTIFSSDMTNSLNNAVTKYKNDKLNQPLYGPNGEIIPSDYGINQQPGKKSFLNNLTDSIGAMTSGEKVGLGTNALSLGLKAVESFMPVQKEPYRYNNAAISLNSLDPTAALGINQSSYNSALNDLNNQSTTGSNRAALAANLFGNKLKSDNDVLMHYGEANQNNAVQYEQRMAQRNAENNAMSYQVDDLNSRNRGARENMRMGLYGDLSTMGLNTANVLNNRLSQQATLAALKKMAPDVYNNLMKQMDLQIQKTIKG